MNRRRFVVSGAIALAAPAVAMRAVASTGPRVLNFSHLHTGERLEVEYFAAGKYLPDALAAVNHLLRDFRNGQSTTMDATLLDLLFQLRQHTGTNKPFEIISAYRSPATNDMLHKRSSGVASGSLHTKGQAIDIRLADVPLAHLRDTALSLRRGGVGYYAGSNFVHVDTGRVRAW